MITRRGMVLCAAVVAFSYCAGGGEAQPRPFLVIHWEEPYEDGGSRMVFEPLPEGGLETVGYETKGSADKVEAIRESVELRTKGLYTVREYRGCLFVQPSAPFKTNLDVPVTLDLEGVSTWGAFRALIVAVNRGDLEYGDRLIPREGLALESIWDKRFLEERIITIHARNTPARDALVDILRQSSVMVQIRYYHAGDWSNMDIIYVDPAKFDLIREQGEAESAEAQEEIMRVLGRLAHEMWAMGEARKGGASGTEPSEEKVQK